MKTCALCNAPCDNEAMYCKECIERINEEAARYFLIGDVLSGRVYEYGGGMLI